ncbi:MAG: hypothetical protein NVSMB25_02550 [Thermoleophilaceae bacterium]
MSATTPALIGAAAGVGFGHAILPDHWVPLAVVGRTQRYPIARVARLSALAGVAHVLVSVLLGALLIAIGLQFRSSIENAQGTIVGCILILTGIGFALLELSGHGHGHSHGGPSGHEHSHGGPSGHGHSHGEPSGRADVGGGLSGNVDLAPIGHADDSPTHHQPPTRPAGGLRGLAAIMVPFGAAASPDLTILPVFLAASAAGALAAIGALVVFSIVTIGTIVTLTLVASVGGYQIQGRWLERWGNTVTALVLILIGALVLAGLI